MPKRKVNHDSKKSTGSGTESDNTGEMRKKAIDDEVEKLKKELQETKEQLELLKKSQNKQKHSEASNVDHDIRYKTKLFANISHELRTPITLIKNPAAHLLKHGNISSDDRVQLAKIYRNTKRLSQLVEQILDINRIESGTMIMSVRKVEICKYMKLITQSFSYLMELKNISCRCEIPSKKIYLYVDPEKVEKIMYNLLSNAAKFTEKGGLITIRLLETEDQVKIEVTDTGVGMDEKQAESVFERFVSHGQQNHKYREGLGIGLSLSNELMQMHQGEISVNSEEGKGSCFTLSFKKGRDHFNASQIFNEPYVPEDVYLPEPQYAGVQPLAVKRKEVKVLLVEDNTELSDFIANLLFEKGYEVVRVENGKKGLDMATSIVPDIIISDIMMPVMDGFSFIRELKKDPDLRNIPTIFLTALTDIQDKLHGFTIGINDYIVKPFEQDELIVRIQNLLSFKADRENTFKELELDMVHTQSREEDAEFVSKMILWIETNMESGNLDINKLAENVAKSRSTLYREIRRTTGFSAAAFIKEVRLQFAKRLVESNTVKGLSELSRKVGYGNSSYFRDQYLLRFGKNPFD